MLQHRRDSTLSSALMQLTSIIQDRKNSDRRSCSRSVLTLSIKMMLSSTSDYLDLLDRGKNCSKLQPLSCPLRNISDAMRLTQVALSNFLHKKTRVRQEESLSVVMVIRIVTRVPPPMEKNGLGCGSVTDVSHDRMRIEETSLTSAEDMMSTPYREKKTVKRLDSKYIDFKAYTEKKYYEHLSVIKKLVEVGKVRSKVVNQEKLKWRRNKARDAGRMVLLLKHLDTIHYGNECPYCCVVADTKRFVL